VIPMKACGMARGIGNAEEWRRANMIRGWQVGVVSVSEDSADTDCDCRRWADLWVVREEGEALIDHARLEHETSRRNRNQQPGDRPDNTVFLSAKLSEDQIAASPVSVR